MAISDKIGNVFNKAKSGTIAVSLEAKKKMRESSIKGEISSLEAKINSLYTQIGREAYNSLYEKLYGYDKLKELMDQIKEIMDEIGAKEKELADAMAGFDKEIAEVKGTAPHAESAPAEAPPAAAPATPPVADGKVFCSQCGAENSTDSNFCNSCGAKMEK